MKCRACITYVYLDKRGYILPRISNYFLCMRWNIRKINLFNVQKCIGNSTNRQHLLGYLKIGFNFYCLSSLGDWSLKPVFELLISHHQLGLLYANLISIFKSYNTIYLTTFLFYFTHSVKSSKGRNRKKEEWMSALLSI